MRPWLPLAFAIGCGAAPRSATDARKPEPPVELAAGEVVEIAVEHGRAAIRVATPSGLEAFAVVLASTRLDAPGADYPYRITRAASAPTAHVAITRCSTPHATIAKPQPEVAPRAAGPPVVGAKRTFAFRGHGSAEPIAARAVAVGASSVVWVDDAEAHRAILDDAFVADFLKDFDTVILPRARAVFGRESDIDRDGKVALLFTPLTAISAVAFFSGCDLRPRSACPGSNEGEVLYLTPPNAIRPPYNTPRAMKEILAHELEHLIHYRAKVLDHGAPDDPDSAYLQEGFGALAQDVLGFQAGNLYVTAAGLEGIDDVSFADLIVPGTGYDEPRNGPLRGAAYLFARWLYDRAGGDAARADGSIDDAGGPSFVRALVAAPGPALGALPRLTGARIADVEMDFFTTLAVSNRSAMGDASPKNGCFAYLPTQADPVTGRVRGADLFAKFHGMAMHGPSFRPASSAEGRLRAGGVAYLALAPTDAPARGGTRELTIEVDERALPRVRVARLR